jgi:OOP family OmpA-OmpF porin
MKQSRSASFKILPRTRKILDIHFKLNSDEVAEGSRAIIRRFVGAVNHTNSKITVEGYTDSTGSYEKNQQLSKRRAQSVKKLMVQYGVDSSRITAVGKGSLSPISTNDTEAGRAENRRIEIVVE